MLDYKEQDNWPDHLSQWQSPLELSALQATKRQQTAQIINFSTDYKFKTVVGKGNNLQYNGVGQTMIAGRTFEFQQLHFHFPAEHLVNGKTASMELHFVQQNAIGQLSVLAFLVETGTFNEQLAPFYQHFTLNENEETVFAERLNMRALTAGRTQKVYRYLGSLTTPPLLRGVEWWVFEEPLTVSPTQLETLRTDFASDNARRVQKVNERPIVRYQIQPER
ncbi:carbonic anhydrase family protein [Liquorilactobacillus satsumensis]|uniref:carbonic anhydrase family protein n=1 Tax=Liquorilactobacillus satsumensis TaxID=259059 RepID=UPI0021C287F5|nr:carbonic anhydrase family protein [Liquorilactobacillus satsumensis]MCP9313391.1 carbonic anhydrase family protein [Liquorilactobacillus satsumensis]MCP9329147.1 carbonic anhydrase family protein [Liquorilactobacillus satsumensis]MCP9360087.1 carbonic anhydrase family protein [Liquorilactobacillus satsumensis]